jgi:hypothetical protein
VVNVTLEKRAYCPEADGFFKRHDKPPTTSPPSRVPAFVAAGVSAIAVGSFAYFALRGDGKYHDLLHSCAPSCSSDSVSPVTSAFIVADVSLGVAVVAAGIATWLFLAQSSPSASTSGRAKLFTASF